MPLSGFWTWDHSTNWSLDVTRVESGCFNRYAKTAESFIEDYRLLMDMMAENGIPCLIVWGLFRDAHGGEGAVHRLLRLARERGVRVLAGVGVNAYGGVYWEGDHPRNLATWLRKRPELRAAKAKSVLPNSCGREIACPSRDENVRWMQDGVRWLMGNFDVAGMNLETGDYGLCGCDLCRSRAKDREGAYGFEDMARVLPPVIEAARSTREDAVITYATYSPFTPEMLREPPPFVAAIPDAVCQWTLTRMVGPEAGAWPEGLRPPTRRSVGFSHWGSQWTQPNTRHAPIIDHIRDICGRGFRSGLEGVFIHGEVASREDFAWRLNYAAFAWFLRHPEGSLDEFARANMADEFGGEEEACCAVRWIVEPADLTVLEGRVAESLRLSRRFADPAGRAWRCVAGILFARTL
jgi:hypothetical protein